MKPLTLIGRWERARALLYARVVALEAPHVGHGVVIHPSVRVTGSRRVCIGMGSVVCAGSRLHTYPPGELILGAHVQIGPNVILDAVRRLEIGDETTVGPSVYISTGRHRFSGEGPVRYQGGEQLQPIIIGRGVEIGAHAVVLPGTRIMDGAVVVANSVVRGVIAPVDTTRDDG